MANEIAWSTCSRVTIPFKSDYELQREAVMGRAEEPPEAAGCEPEAGGLINCGGARKSRLRLR
jgi:hypothetical protein